MRGHRSGTDDVLAAWQAWRAAPDALRVLDLGSGHGTVTLLLSQVLPPAARFVAVEAQAVSADLCRRNVAENGLSDRVTVIEADLRDRAGAASLGGPFDLVTGTPPFMPPGAGPMPADGQRAAARFELRGGVEDYLAAAARLLSPDGVACVLMDGAQDARCRAAAAAAGLALVATLAVTPREGRRIRYRGYVARPAAAAAARAAVREEALTVRDASGAFTPGYGAVRAALDLDGT